MRYQEFYERCIEVFARHPGMPREDYEALNGVEQRRLHLAAIALIQALDQAYRAEDPRAENFKFYLRYYEGPLTTEGAIHNGAVLDPRTLAAWNALRATRNVPALPASLG
jgi:hypothetical protein